MPKLKTLRAFIFICRTTVCLTCLLIAFYNTTHAQAPVTTNSALFDDLQQQAEDFYGLRKGLSTDSVIDKMIFLAEQSLDPVLMKRALFENPMFLSENYFSLGEAQRKRKYIDRAMEYARRINQPDLIALAYLQLSFFYRFNGELGKADYYANIANTSALASSNDTAIVYSLLQQGLVNQAMSKVLIALQKYHNALDLTQEKKLNYLESEVLQTMAIFYKKLNKTSVGRELIFRSVAISKQHGNMKMLMDDYMVLSLMCLNNDLECQRNALLNAINIADSLHIKSAEMEARRYLFYTYLDNITSDSLIQMLNNDVQLKEYLANVSPGTLDWTRGEIFYYAAGKKNYDSAIFYLKKAEDPIYMNSVMIRKKNYVTELAMTYAQTDIPMAVETYKSLLGLEQQTADYSGMQAASHALKTLYDQQANYQQAYFYNKLFDEYTKEINEQARQDDLALMMMDNDRKEKQRKENELLQQKNQYYNMQYSLIAILIFSLFIGLAMMGLYKVSQRTVRALGFFSFLLLFEYITLLSKKWVTIYTGGTPWQDFLFMIVLALVMLPLHHWLEHQVIDYLSTKKMIKPHKTDRLFAHHRTPKPPPPQSTTEGVASDEKSAAPIRNITS